MAKIQATLDDSALQRQISNLSNQKIRFNNIELNTADLVSQIESVLHRHKFNINVGNVNTSNFTRQFQNTGNNVGKQFAQSLSSSLNNIHLVNGGMGNISRMLQGAGFDKGSMAAVTQELDRMVLSINKISTKQLSNGNIKMTITGVDELNRAVQVVREFDRETGAVANTSKTFSQSFNEIAKTAKEATTALTNGSIEKFTSQVGASYSKLSNTGHEKLTTIKDDIEELKRLQIQMQSTTDQTALVGAYERYNEVLTRVKNNLDTVSNSQKQFASASDISSLRKKMETWLQTNTKAAKTFGSTVRQLITELSALSTTDSEGAAKLKHLADSFEQVDVAATSMELKGKTFTSTFKGALQSITKYVGASTLIYSAFNALKSGVQSVVELNTALVDLQKTSTATQGQLESFYYSANETAKKLGATTQEVIQAAADWSRLGYSLEDSQTMAEVSSIFASISPGMDIETATDGLVSVMKAFGIEADDALDGIASKINAIGNTQAVNNEDIVNFLTRSSSAMREANNTLEETIALGTAATEITRDAEGVGTALKAVSMRIRGYDEETEEFIGNTEVLSGEIADLTKTASKPEGISLFKDEDKTEYKSTCELLRDISEIYDELTDKEQAELLEKLAGKQRGQVVAAILSNFDAVESSLTTMASSAGSAMDEMAIIEESLEFKLNALKETGVGIFQNIFESDSMGVVIDGLTLILNLVDKFTEQFGLLGTVIAGIGIYKLVKDFD